MSPPHKGIRPTRWVPKDIIRQAFNAGQYWEKVKSGVLVPTNLKDRHLDEPSKREPEYTRSQYIIYRNPNGEFVAGVHQYLRPDRTLGASGKPDPKRLIVNGILWVVRSKSYAGDGGREFLDLKRLAL